MNKTAVKDFLKKYQTELIAFFLVFAVFAPSLRYGFQTDWDDSAYVCNNPYLTFTWDNIIRCFSTGTLGLRTPLTTFSFMLDRLIWQTQEVAFGYRLTNILLHAASSVLLLKIIKRLGVRPRLALCCALFWAIQPQRLESVVWIAERKDVLSGFFALLSFYIFMRSPFNWKNITGAVFLFVLSLLAKPSAIGLPLAACVYLCYIKPEKFNWKYILAGIGSMGAIVFLLCHFLNIFPKFIPMPRLFSVVFHNALFYSVNGIIPLETNPCYPYIDWSDFWMVPVAVMILFIMLYLGRKAQMDNKSLRMYFLAFLLVFAALFAPFTGAFIFNPTDYADRYSYFPNLAVWVFLAFLLERVFSHYEAPVRYLKLAGIVLGVYMIGMTLWYMPMWKDTLTLVRWGIYTSEVPNDKFLMIHAKYGFIENDPEILQETMDFLKKKDRIPNLPRDDERMKTGRKCTIDALDLSINIIFGRYYTITNKPLEAAAMYEKAIQKYDHFVSTNQQVLLLERHYYEASFKHLVMQLFLDTNDKDRLRHMETWASKTTDRYGKIFQDYGFTGALKFHRKDYQGAIDDWKKILELNKKAPNVLENIRRAEQKLKEQR